MKRSILALAAILAAAVAHGQEMTLSGGFEAGFGVFDVDNDFGFKDGSNYFLCNEKTESVFFAPGISLAVKLFLFPDKDVSTGFFFRDRAIFMTNAKKKGTASVNGIRVSINEDVPLFDEIFFSIMDFDIGGSVRFKISNRLLFYTDLGVNFTIMDSETFETGETLNYWGFGIFSALALQVNVTQSLYFEFGLNAIINAISSHKGNYKINGMVIEYEDSGRGDLLSAAPYIHVGWRIDLLKLNNKLQQKS